MDVIETIIQVFMTVMQLAVAILIPFVDFRKEGKITRWGIILSISAFAGGILSFINAKMSDDKEIKFRKELKDSTSSYQAQLLTADSMYNKKLVDTIRANTENTTEILAKYGYKVDSANNALQKMIDSSKTEVPPDFYLDRITIDSVIGTKYWFTVALQNKNASAENVKLNLYAATKFGVFKYLNNEKIVASLSNQKIVTDLGYGLHFSIINPGSEILYFLLSGSYTNANGKKHYRTHLLYAFNLLTKEFGFPANNDLKTINNIFKKEGIK
jgi:hypothetical protein